MATMKDIARMAKVSTSTVSHVINNSRYVSDEIRQKVLKVVEQLDYQPSVLARSLKIKSTKTIGMIVTTTNNPFFSEVINAVERYCNQHNYNLIISNITGNETRLNHNIQTLVQKQIDGLLLMCAEESVAQTAQLKLTLPMVIMDWWPTKLNADKIFENSEYGGYLATKTLIEQGHTQIGIITGNLAKPLAQNRLQGYKQALAEHGLIANPQWIIESSFDFAGGVIGMEKLLACANRPTAVFACSDTIAMGAYQTVWRHKLQIPQDISIIGYDNINLAQYLAPPLTTIHQPKQELGQQAVEILLARIQQNNLENYRTFILQPSLIWRESVACIKLNC